VTALPVHSFDLGIAPYLPLQELQRRLREAVADGRVTGILLLLEHEPVITLGTRAGTGDLRGASLRQAAGRLTGTVAREEASPGGRVIELVKSERGGQATLHAPGQLVCYPVVPIPDHDLSSYVHGLEEALILLLSGLGITATRRRGAPGVYVGTDKIASVGLRCSRWVASHGTSLNVDMDLSLFDLIVSCGEPDLHQTSIAALTDVRPSMRDIKRAYLEAAREIFGWDLLPLRSVTHERVETELRL